MTKAIDRSQVIFETYPGATNDIDAYAEACDGWICEEHPNKPWPHDDCAGPGMLKNEPHAKHD